MSSSCLTDALSARIRSRVETGDCRALRDSLTELKDPRKLRGVRHPFGDLIFVLVLGVLAGMATVKAAAQWANEAGREQIEAAGIKVPSRATLSRAARLVDACHLDQIICTWMGVVAPAQPRTVVAIDGKELRGAKNGGGVRVHLLAMVRHVTCIVLGQVDVGIKTNEIPLFTTLLDQIKDITGWVITADALHTLAQHATYLVARGAHFCFTVKRNQPTLYAQLAALPWGKIKRGAFIRETTHGRYVTRSVKVCTIAAGIYFPHAVQVARIVRKRKTSRTAKASIETVYVIVSLDEREASPVQIASWVQNHWTIENKLHHVRDVTFDEDRHQIRLGSGPRTMAILRNLAISLINIAGATDIAHTLRHIAMNPPIALGLTGQ